MLMEDFEKIKLAPLRKIRDGAYKKAFNSLAAAIKGTSKYARVSYGFEGGLLLLRQFSMQG